MRRPFIVCLLAAAASFACVIGPEGQPGGDTATGGSSTDETTAPAPTTGSTATATTLDPTTSGTDAGSASSSTGTDECWFQEIGVEPVVPRLMLVLDKSGSMATAANLWDHDGDDADDDGAVDGDPNDSPATPKITRWRSLYLTVESVLQAFDGRMDFGAVLFPAVEATKEYGAAACPVHEAPDVPIGGDQAAAILAAIPPPSATKLFGGSPAAAAITTGVAGLVADVASDEPRYLVLVTDGAANCPIEPQDDLSSSLFEIYDENLRVVVADALAAGIPTFVVGIAIADEVSPSAPDGNPDATNNFERLNEVAEAGGRARDGAEKFYNATDEAELHAAFLDISASVTSCTLALDHGLHVLQYVARIVVGGRDPLVYGQHQVEDCASESGWRFTDETLTRLELCGQACAKYRRFGELDLELQCRDD